MDYVFSSSNNGTMLVSSTKASNRGNNDLNHEEEGSSSEQFPSPFLDEILQNHHHKHHLSPANEESASPSKTKRVRKKRSAGKKDRHSKIYTAQGLRDRRMRLSLHIARKFFGLQDMLGFDKASKTIEWLFCKSKQAIEEVTKNVKSQNTSQTLSREDAEKCESPLSDCEEDSGIKFNDASNKGKQLKIQDEIKDTGNSKKLSECEIMAKESRDKARARARERTRNRMIFNNLEKSKQMFEENPNVYFDQIQLGFSGNPNNHYIQGTSSSPLEYLGTHHFYDQTQFYNIAQNKEDNLGDLARSSTYFSGYGYNKNFANPPTSWLNSSNTFLGFFRGLYSENFAQNYGLLQNLAPSTGDIQDQNFNSVFIPSSNFVHFQTQNQSD